ncbi:hypothetical protein PFISCL1PPCAC_525, partial [Pristionchus fissidentatus]
SPGAVQDSLSASGASRSAIQGFTCLACWLLFNLWILRDYFFPSFFEPLYNEQGLSKKKLSIKKNEIIRRKKISRAFSISAAIPFGGSISAARLSTLGREDRSVDEFIV